MRRSALCLAISALACLVPVMSANAASPKLYDVDGVRDSLDRSAVVATGAAIVASANPGCLMQLRAALPPGDHSLTCVHTIQLVDASIRGLAPPS